MRIRVVALVAVATVVVMSSAVPASASARVVMGVQTPVDSGPCFSPNAVFSTSMDGGLLGCWWVDTISPDVFDPSSYRPSGTAVFRGTEHFTGCLNEDGDAACDPGEPWGTFHTTYTFTARFAADGSEVHGRCHHPIVSGTDDFAGISGVINFTDDVSTSPPTSPYWGPVRL